MRRLLDFLYDGSAWLAALAMIGVLLMVLLSIVSRQFGFHAPGTDAYAGYSMAAVAGTPSITVPVGASHGLPLGLMFMGRPYSEGDLLGFAYALEQLTRARTKPEYRPTLTP